MANDKDFVVNGPVVVGKDTKVTVGSIGSAQEGYYISGASYDNKSFSVTTEASTGGRGLAFKSDGTKMYVASLSSDAIYQYSLSTPYDVTTASYDSVSFSVLGQDGTPVDLTFNLDGTRFYLLGFSGDSLYQYSLSTAWDISTASYDSVSLSVSSQDTLPFCITFNSSGTKLYMGGNTNNSIYQYSLSTAFDLSTASYDSVSLDISTEDQGIRGIALKSDNNKLYMLGNSNDTVFEYSLSSSSDLSTASYSNISFSLAAQSTDVEAFVFSADGTKMFSLSDSSGLVYQYSATKPLASVDLSTGNYFVDSPSGDYTYTFANPGDVQAFQIQATGGSEAVAETFSTTLYSGTGAAQDIENGLDLSGDGGLVWMKSRTGTDENTLMDTERGIGSYLDSASTLGNQGTSDVYVTSYNTNGFSVGLGNQINRSGEDFVSWSFKKQTKFFDVVTYTGDGTNGRAIPHNLGETVGTLIIKATNGASHWITYHRDLYENFPANADVLFLDLTNSKTGVADVIKGVSNTTFTVGNNSAANGNSNIHANNSGYTYVAYLFAHDTASDGLIQCGSWAGNGQGDFNGPTVNLGWQPQWILAKNTTTSGDQNWNIYDVERGLTADGAERLMPNSSNAEVLIQPTAYEVSPTGFKVINSAYNQNGSTHIYMAIRSASAPAITWPTNIEWTGGSTPSTPAEGETDVYTFTTDDGGTTYTGIQSIDNAS